MRGRKSALAVALTLACAAPPAEKIDTTTLPATATIVSEKTATPTADSLAGMDGDGAAATVRSEPEPGSGPIALTPSELDALARQLIVPVSGVAREDLPDNFDEMRGTRRHDAMDILAPRGTPVLAAIGGRIEALHTSKAGGLMVYASDPSRRFVLMYAHLDRYADGLREEMPLARGQVIGYVGTTGNAPPNVPHLHFAITRVRDADDWWRGTPVDPRPLLVRPR